jgi:deazaflavin-dependent oxidoreductase (nitroreductase family)
VNLRRSKFIWRVMRLLSGGLIATYGERSPAREIVLLLTTSGRKSGLRRVTPLQYEEVGGDYVVASARGTAADWYRNLAVDPCVEVQVRGERFPAHAEPITDPAAVADFLELRLERHPRMVGAMLRAEGLPPRPSRAELEAFARKIAIVRLHPEGDPGAPR